MPNDPDLSQAIVMLMFNPDGFRKEARPHREEAYVPWCPKPSVNNPARLRRFDDANDTDARVKLRRGGRWTKCGFHETEC